jgi:hypothetical protein
MIIKEGLILKWEVLGNILRKMKKIKVEMKKKDVDVENEEKKK